jgi:hypothetical protein
MKSRAVVAVNDEVGQRCLLLERWSNLKYPCSDGFPTYVVRLFNETLLQFSKNVFCCIQRITFKPEERVSSRSRPSGSALCRWEMEEEKRRRESKFPSVSSTYFELLLGCR